MDQIRVVSLCRELGCCDGCCLRFLGHKSPSAYEDTAKFILKYQKEDQPANITTTAHISINPDPVNTETSADNDITQASTENGISSSNEENSTGEGKENGSPPAKRKKLDQCVCCLGILQPATWPPCFEKVKNELDRKGYVSTEFACALSAPIATLIREKVISLRVCAECPEYDPGVLTPLKEAWKWSFGVALSASVGRQLSSGAVCPLLVTITMQYGGEHKELELLRSLSPAAFSWRSRGRRDRDRDHDRDYSGMVTITRRAAESALLRATLQSITSVEGWQTIPASGGVVECGAVECVHSPVYIAGRYIKLSRSLPQTPWVLNGERMMESSVQEIICAPIAQMYRIPPEQVLTRFKFISAGREDVDVRCLGDGRPFAIEVLDPWCSLTPQQLSHACAALSDQQIKVHNMVHVTRQQLEQLKCGEETKAKTYHALCVKMESTREQGEGDGDTSLKVTEEDIRLINTFRNASEGEPCLRVQLTQRTPLRVLHRRPLLARTRNILALSASLVPGHPRLFCIRVVTEAGTYIKEWAHGECGRTVPSLGDAIGHRVDILALDVVKVHLQWPPEQSH